MNSTINWNEVIKREARGSNDEDFGEVQDVSNGYVFVQKGIFNKQKFFIPQEKAESYDGDILRFGISKEEAESIYQGDTFPTSSQNMDKASDLQVSDDDLTIPLVEKRLDVNKRVEESQATITKEPVKETKTIQVVTQLDQRNFGIDLVVNFSPIHSVCLIFLLRHGWRINLLGRNLLCKFSGFCDGLFPYYYFFSNIRSFRYFYLFSF